MKYEYKYSVQSFTVKAPERRHWLHSVPTLQKKIIPEKSFSCDSAQLFDIAPLHDWLWILILQYLQFLLNTSKEDDRNHLLWNSWSTLLLRNLKSDISSFSVDAEDCFVSWSLYVRLLHRGSYTAQKMKFFIKDFSSKYDQIRSFLRIWSDLFEKYLMENFMFYAMLRLSSSWKYPGKFNVTLNRFPETEKQALCL